MAIGQTVEIPKELEEMTPEQLIQLAKVKDAQRELAKLESHGIKEFINSANQVTDLDGVYKLVSATKWRIEKIRRVLHPTPESQKGKRGRKKKNQSD